MTLVKICGITRPEDVALACGLGAAYVGFNFSSVSPRRLSLETARGLADAAAPGVARVGIFVDEGFELIAEAIEAGRLDLAQIHRPLREEDFEGIPIPIIAVTSVAEGAAPVPSQDVLGRCRSLLFDTAAGKRRGGAGAPFDWRVLEGRSWPVPLFLAGGLNSENVGEAIARVRPWAVDVASGVESAPGIKDEQRMKRFFAAVEEADAKLE